MTLGKRAAAEFFGTFWLVFGGCGAAVLDAAFPGLGIGFLGVALAFGLALPSLGVEAPTLGGLRGPGGAGRWNSLFLWPGRRRTCNCPSAAPCFIFISLPETSSQIKGARMNS